MRHFLPFLILILTAPAAHAQWISKIINTLYAHDSAYITRMPLKFVVRLDSRNWEDHYSIKEDGKTLLNMESDLQSEISGKVGLGILSVGYSVGVGKKYDSKKFNLGIYAHRFSLDYDYVNTGSKTNIVLDKRSKDKEKISYTGLDMTMNRYKFLYFLNSKRYSNDANYSGNLRMKQKKNAGSPILGFSYAYHKIGIDTTKFTVGNISISPNITNLEYIDYCLNIGYAYTFVKGKYWSFNVTDVPEVGLKANRFSDKKYQFAVNNMMKVSAVYNHLSYFLGISCQYDSYWNFHRKSSLENSIQSFNAFFGVKL